jgi:CheY-like chemotaxis protein
MDAGHVQPRLRHFALETVFGRLRAVHTTMAQDKGLRLKIEETALIIFSDSSLIGRALSNLLTNAIRYTEHGEVCVRATFVTDSQVEIQVSDTGVGIAAAYHERVFDEFFQLHNPERDRQKGLGLGLSIVKRIAALLDYALVLRSEPGVGTRITLRVPLGESAKQDAEEKEATRANFDILRGRRILVVEDEANVRVGTLELLEHWGCEVRAVADIDEALRATNAWQPEIVLVDLRLREQVSGIEAIEALRGALGNTFAVLVVSGDTAVEVLAQVKARRHLMLHKPVRPAQLRAALSQLAATS